jgi:hypothetical protein
MDRTREAQAALAPRTRSSGTDAGAGLDLLQLVARSTAKSPPRAARRSDESCDFTASSSRNDLASARLSRQAGRGSPPLARRPYQPRPQAPLGPRPGYWHTGNCPGLV